MDCSLPTKRTLTMNQAQKKKSIIVNIYMCIMAHISAFLFVLVLCHVTTARMPVTANNL